MTVARNFSSSFFALANSINLKFMATDCCYNNLIMSATQGDRTISISEKTKKFNCAPTD